jgi:methylated-DNA-[protein]-cysteine S-methyltransferase
MLDRGRAAFASYFRGHRAELDARLPDPHGSDGALVVQRCARDPAGARELWRDRARVGRPGAARAVGDANRRNPIAIAIPCHRVIGGDGRLVGYAGGLERKRWLLAHEAECARRFQAASSKSNGPESAGLPTALARSRASAAASI